MAGNADFCQIPVMPEVIERARERYAEMGERAEAGEHGWAGFAAELAIIEAINAGPKNEMTAAEAPTLDYDITLTQAAYHSRVEVKTRVATRGWIHPAKYQWVVVPTHQGREPIKPAADLVLFAWYPLTQSHLWVLGSVRGAAEFQRRAVFYHENDPLPRGGWAGDGGAYAIHVDNLRPLPRGLFV